MPHELLDALETHLSSPETSLDNRDNWGLVQKWLLLAAQLDGGNGDATKTRLHIAFQVNALLSNDNHIHHSISDQLNATLGRRPKPTVINTTVGLYFSQVWPQSQHGI
jgi:hypothetical protein